MEGVPSVPDGCWTSGTYGDLVTKFIWYATRWSGTTPDRALRGLERRSIVDSRYAGDAEYSPPAVQHGLC
jgi:hypothetical protein